MADSNLKLELVLLGKDLLGKILSKDIGFLKQFKKEGEAAAKAADKLNNARKKASPRRKEDTAGIKKTTAEINKERLAQEKLNNAIKRQPKRGRGGKGGGAQRDLMDDAVLAGAGTGTLWLGKKGMEAAMTKQAALTDLRNSFHRANVDLGIFNSQMADAERQADVLGNKLPGTTADFINLFSTMRERGVDVKTVLEGAGEAAALLAVTNKADVQQTGENLARYGVLFGLKGKEYIQMADLMSRIRTSKGLESEELIEASKYFGGRTAVALGMTNMKGAEESMRFLAFLREKTSLEGGRVGTSTSSFFQQFIQSRNKKDDPVKELEKLSGEKLTLFDTKGKFLGFENVIREFGKLKGKLSDEQMLDFGNKIAGEEGASIFAAMVQKGDQFKSFNDDINQTISLQDKAGKVSENFSNKIEALTGSLENLGSAGFTPLLKPLGNLTDKTNDWVGSLTDAAKAQPGIARMVTTIGLLGGAVLAFKGGAGLLSRFGGDVTNSFTTAWKSADTFKGKLGALKNFAKSPITISLQIMAAGMTIDHILKVFEEVKDRAAKLAEDNQTLRQQYDNLMGGGDLYNYSRQTGEQRQKLDSFADKMLETMKQGRALEVALEPSRRGTFENFWSSQRVYSDQWRLPFGSKDFDEEKAASAWRKSDVASGMRDPNVLARLLAKIESGGGMKLSDDAIKMFESAIEKVAGSEKMQQARQVLSEERKGQPTQFLVPFQQSTNQTTQLFNRMQQPVGGVSQDFMNLGGRLSPLPGTLSGFNTNIGSSANSINQMTMAAQSFANRVNTLEFKQPGFSFPTSFGGSTGGSKFGFSTFKAKAKGGSVSRNRPYFVGEQGMEMFVPTGSGSIVSNDMLRNRRVAGDTAPNVNLSVHFAIDGAKDPDGIAREIERRLAGVVSELKEQLTPGYLARSVAYEADRDSERL